MNLTLVHPLTFTHSFDPNGLFEAFSIEKNKTEKHRTYFSYLRKEIDEKHTPIKNALRFSMKSF